MIHDIQQEEDKSTYTIYDGTGSIGAIILHGKEHPDPTCLTSIHQISTLHIHLW